MSREQFEYYLNPEELEPFYSELTGIKRVKRNPQKRNRVAKRRRVNSATKPILNQVLAQDSAAGQQSAVENREVAVAVETRDKNLVNGRSSTSTSELNSALPTPRRITAQIRSNGVETPDEDNTPPRTRVRNLLSVHALGQYVFCPRSAILAAEQGDEREVDEPLPRLTYLPNFDLHKIEDALRIRFQQLSVALCFSIVLPVSMVVSLRAETTGYFYLAAAAFFLVLLWLTDGMCAVVRLSMRRIAAIRAECCEPEPSFVGTQPANWWSMLCAGFEPINYQRSFQHPELPLEGRPWRVLHKGDLRIPVIRSPGNRLGNTDDRLFAKHEVRLVAYALLLEADGHLRAPYGLVFPADSPKGFAFAISEEHRRQVGNLLTELQQELNNAQERNTSPGLPENRNHCTNCSYGKPVPTSIRDANAARKAGEQIVVLQSRTEQLFHCDCGDRFGSAPPHRDAIRMGLQAILE